MFLWCDGFDHYGTEAQMLQGVYAEITTGPAGGLDTANPRTGPQGFTFDNSSERYFRRTLLDDKSVFGIGYAFNLSALPTLSDRLVLAQPRTNGNLVAATISVTTTGQVQLRRGNDGAIHATSGQVILAGAYQHFECRIKNGLADGACEVRINGVTVLDVSDVDMGGSAMAQVVVGNTTSFSGGATMRIDDLYAWDDEGSFNNDFIGDRRVQTVYPNDDTVVSDWERSGGVTDYENIDDATPDDDASYLFAESLPGSPPLPLVSEFEFDDLPADVSQVSAVQIVTRVRKTEAGVCNFQASIVSGDVGSPPAASVADGADRPITEQYTYYHERIEADPATGAPWDLAAFNASKLRIARTA